MPRLRSKSCGDVTCRTGPGACFAACPDPLHQGCREITPNGLHVEMPHGIDGFSAQGPTSPLSSAAVVQPRTLNLPSCSRPVGSESLTKTSLLPFFSGSPKRTLSSRCPNQISHSLGDITAGFGKRMKKRALRPGPGRRPCHLSRHDGSGRARLSGVRPGRPG